MSKRPFIYLGIAIAFILIVLFLERPDLPKSDVEDNLIYPNFAVETIEECTIDQLINGVSLRRKGDGWEVSRRITELQKSANAKNSLPIPDTTWYSADKTRVNTALANFTDLQMGVIVSSKPENQVQYNLGPIGLKLNCNGKNGKELVNVTIGKNGPDFISTYLQKGGEKDTMLTSRSLVGAFSPIIDDWRDHTIWAIGPVDIINVEIKGPKDLYRMYKKDDRWQLTFPKEIELEVAKTKDLVTNIAGLNASGFAYGEEISKTNFSKPELEIVLKTSDGKDLNLKIAGKNQRGNYYAKLGGDTTVFLIDPNEINKISNNAKELTK